jgi:fatty aldehyde-generating acyl-ACP reductase
MMTRGGARNRPCVVGPSDFAFIIHPIDPKADVKRKYPLLGTVLPRGVINFLSRFFPPVYISRVEGIRSVDTGKTIGGWLIACPLTPERMLSLPVPVVYHKIVQTGRLAERLGATILGLGAFTSVVGDAGVTIASDLNIPVTTGDSYSVAVALEAVREGARRMGVDMAGATAAVVGATGAIGQVVSKILAAEVAELILIGRRLEGLQKVVNEIDPISPAHIRVSADVADIASADLVLTVTSALDAVIEPHHLRCGAVVCDVSRPRDVSLQVARERDDVLIIDGGMVQVPGEADFGFDFGFPPRMAYACMAEVMILALEGRLESYTLGRSITLAQVQAIAALGKKHGFTLAGFRAFEKPVTDEQIARIRARRDERLRHKEPATEGRWGGT